MNKIEISTVIYSGENALDRLRHFENRNVFIVADPFIIDSRIIEQIESRLKKGNNKWTSFSDILPDPPIENVVKGVEEIAAFKPDLIIAIGGGSAIDAAKAMKEFSGRIYKYEDLPLIAIPTTSGTGSEVTSFSVITDNEKSVKYPLVSDSLLPEEAILDTELVKTVPKQITADTGMDTLTHAIEAYVAKNANDFTDAFAEKAIRLVFDNLVEAYNNGENIEAREKMHHASTMAGIAFNIAGLGINHSIAHSCGAKFNISHGRLNAILLPSVIAFNAGVQDYTNTDLKPTADKYADLAQLLGLPATNNASGTRSLIKEIKKLKSDLDIKEDFQPYNIEYTANTLEEVAQSALQDSCTITNPEATEAKDIISILKELM